MAKTPETTLPVTRAEKGWAWPWEQFEFVNRLGREMERSLEHFAMPRRFFLHAPQEVDEASWIPDAEFFEKDGRLVVRTDLPGLNKEEIKVEVNNERLIVHGERKREAEEKLGRFTRTERAYGRFYRVFALPEGVNAETAKATFKNGVLEVTLASPTVVESRTKKVEIEEGPAKVPVKAA